MKQLLFLLIILTFTCSDFKTSANYNNEAEKLEREGKYEEAIPLLDKAIEKNPENIYALINRGVDKSILEDYEGAINDYTRVITIDPNNTLAYFNRGLNKERIKDYLGAIEDFDKAIKTKDSEFIVIKKIENSLVDTEFEFDVSIEEIRFGRGFARYNMDSLMLAFNDFDFCIAKDYEKASSLYWRGIIYLTYGMNQEGCSDMEEAHKLGDLDAKELLDKYCK